MQPATDVADEHNKYTPNIAKEYIGCACLNILFILAVIFPLNIFIYLLIFGILAFYALLYQRRNMLIVGSVDLI